MNLLNNLNVSRKIGLLILISAVFLVITGFTGYRYLSYSKQSLDVMYNHELQSVKLLEDCRAQARAIEADIYKLMLITDTSESQRILEDIQKRANLFNENIKAYEMTNLDDQEKALLAKTKNSLSHYRDTRKEVLNLASQKRGQEAYNFYNSSVKPHADEFQNYLVDLAHIAEKQADVAAQQNEKDFGKAVLILSITIIIALVLTISLGFIISKKITNPLSSVVSNLKQISEGNLGIEKLNIDSKDELGQLSQMLNETVIKLRGLITQVINSSELVAASSEELTASAEQSAQACNHIAITVTEVAEASAQQLSALEQSSASVEQMSASIEQIAADTGVVTATAQKTNEAAISGQKAVTDAVRQMNQIETVIAVSSDIIEDLGSKSEEIGEIVDTISAIAGQTNLLALNAAIEAARAGEQGRGFAVVAEEVRKLAEQSQEASKQISTLIAGIQTETEKAITAMKAGTEEVKNGSRAVNVAGEGFSQINANIVEVTDQIKDISYAIQQMASGSREIVQSTKVVSDLSKHTTGQTQNISAATEEQSASVQEIASSSQALAKLAEELQTIINKFKL
ncbi:methyl-accepting chemotaxis protein [Dendrosporobacter sp. 1207_IL3150]|uniref:methyl-accepting chemotaxis protein n=1 Tax=Dendrosporobacter sp. 1207_IL3150 TaxID=3084054 RepID=UPI002FD91F23